MSVPDRRPIRRGRAELIIALDRDDGEIVVNPIKR
jgi:hypothetical protein